MKSPFFPNFNRSLQTIKRWYEETPERALEQAYDAALMIKSIEDEHFDSRRIAPLSKLSDNTNAYFASELKKYLKIAEIRLSEFRASRSFINTTDGSANARSGKSSSSDKEKAGVILEKLKFIDQTIDRYRLANSTSVSLVPISKIDEDPQSQVIGHKPNAKQLSKISETQLDDNENEGIMDKTGVLPRSIVGTLNRIKRDLDPNSEQRVVQNFRSTKAKTLISIRFLILLIIIPLLAQQLSKALIVGPVVDHFRKIDKTEVFLNYELEEEALSELQTYKERVEFDLILGRAPQIRPISTKAFAAEEPHLQEKGLPHNEKQKPLQLQENSPSKPPSLTKEEKEVYLEEKVQEKAAEIAQEYKRQGSNAIKNVFADIFSVVAFGLVLTTNRREVGVLKSFIDETVYGLSDSAKAFVIILLTDIFVGFHSPHGWEVLMEGVSRHFGLPANREFIFLFIATFPVILDTIFKYWIFRYLNRISPSAVATYRNMNE